MSCTRLLVLALAALGALASAPRPAAAEQVIHSEKSLYRQIIVYEDEGLRCMRFTRQAGGRQSCIDLKQPQRIVFPYVKMMLAALYLAPQPRRVLVIGVGGGTLIGALQRLLPDAQVDAVEIDPAVVRVARDYFGFVPSRHVAVGEEDGRVFVKRALRAGRRYDLVMLDAFDHEYIPEHLLTREFLEEVKGVMAGDGVLAANTFSSSRLYDHESATYRAVFGPYFNLKRANRVVLLRKGGLPDAATLARNAAALRAPLAVLGMDAEEWLPAFSTAVDWRTDARVLTDAYSPSNLLNAMPR